MFQYLIGIDEAGRGPLAGPVAVGAVLVPVDLDWGLVPGVADSKKLTPKDREAVFGRALELKREGVLDLAVSMVSAQVIDRNGITTAVTRGVRRALARLDAEPESIFVKLDGLLKAPRIYENQETIVRGDATEPAISLASIMAKVTRDRHMVRLAKRFPHYGLETHKGYGTKKHREAIERFGLSLEHRSSFCAKLDCLHRKDTVV